MNKALVIQKQVQEILGTEEVYLVGGSVRDLVMGNTPKDYDFTTPMLPDDMEAAVKAAGRHVYAIGKQFGTIGFKVPYNQLVDTGEPIVYDEDDRLKPIDPEANITRHEYVTKFEYVEVTTFRSEIYTNKSRKPVVSFVPSLDEDLARRDFTFNAMVLRSDGTIYDPYGGRLHLHAKKIQTVGKPKDRIMEDPLRVFRAARFAARYDFEIDPNFIGKARQLSDRIFDVSVERWVQELDKLFSAGYAYWGMVKLHEMGVLSRVLPELYSGDSEFPSHVNPFDCTDLPKSYGTADEAWKFLLDHVHTPHEIKDGTRTRRYMLSGICARLKFSNDRTNLILDKTKKKD